MYWKYLVWFCRYIYPLELKDSQSTSLIDLLIWKREAGMVNSSNIPRYIPYRIPIKIRAPLIFGHLACAKSNEASSRSKNARKLKGESKLPWSNEKTANLHQNKDARKLKGREIWGCAKIRGTKIEDAKPKGAWVLIGIRYSNNISILSIGTLKHYKMLFELCYRKTKKFKISN